MNYDHPPSLRTGYEYLHLYSQQQTPLSVRSRFDPLLPGQTVISVITWGELLYGAAKSQNSEKFLEVLYEFASLVKVLPMLPDCCESYSRIRAKLEKTGQIIGNNDLWIAAHALSEGLTLVTNNEKEFKRVPGLNIENWAHSPG
jgi:tRNA(fMet)-specific endonuclease VapC